MDNAKVFLTKQNNPMQRKTDYLVIKTCNTITPEVGTTLKSDEVERMIASGINVEIVIEKKK